MHLVHRTGPPDDREERVLATDVEFADTTLSRMLGFMFRSRPSDDYALVFRFDRPRPRSLHMLFVPFAIDALWLSGTEVTHRKRLPPFVGIGRGTADTIVELPAGVADDVAVGDDVAVVE